MEDLNDLLYNDVEAKFLALQNKKKKRKKRRRKIRLIAFGVILLIGVLYFSSDASKVKSLEVSGNLFYTKEEVLKKAGLSYNTRYIVVPKLYIEYRLHQDDLLKDVEVKKTMNGVITIQVKEKMIIGYFVKDEKNYALVSDGSTKEITSEHLSMIVNFPLIDGFSDEQLKNLAASFMVENREVSQNMIAMISEIHPYQASYDKNMVKLVMQDGNFIYTDYASMPLLNDYKEGVLKNIKEGKKKERLCVVLDDATANIHTEDCSSF